MKYLRYMGEFLSVAGVVWRAEIMQEADAEFETIGALEFDADQPLVIEWGHKNKEEVICSSTATLKIISPGDRTYEDLYSIDVGRVRLDVYRNNSLYWSGCIDTEFYEEPYERLNGYSVLLTFNDMGVLDRLNFDLSGMQTLAGLVSYCVGRCGFICGGIDDSLISTQLTKNGSALKLANLKVRSDNFYDEDGEAKTLADVIEGILQPLALRIVQRAGKVYVYDINGLYTKAAKKLIEWDGSSQTMGVDSVYNNAKITWSTYAQSGNLSPESCWPESIETPPNVAALNNVSGGSMNGAQYFSYHYENKDLVKWWDAQDYGFTIWLAKQGDNAELTNTNVRFFRIVPQYDGTECEGVAVKWTAVAGIKITHPGGYDMSYRFVPYGVNLADLTGFLTDIGPALFKNNGVWVPPVETVSDLLLRVRLDMLLDPRFNPFESAENNGLVNYKDFYSNWNTHGNFVYVPVTIKFQPDGSNDVYVWDNRSIVQADVSNPVKSINGTYGSWVKLTDDETPNAWGWLAYYDAKDRKETSGVLGWKMNRPAINPHTAATLSILTNAEDGQYIPYPNFGGNGGKLWVEVRAGNWQISDGNATLKNVNYNNPKQLWNKISWILFKLPEIEILNGRQFDQTINTDDVEYSALLNRAAKEAIEIDTICGTSAEGVPTARGAYFDASTGKQIKQLTRAGRTTQAEDLLIGTLYSQFAQRRTTLSGEAVISQDPIVAYQEANQGDKLFMIVEEVQDVRLDSSDTTYVEIRPDEYKRNDE